MAKSLNQVIAERRSALGSAKRAMRGIDTIQEKAERRLASLLSRRRKVPELEDLQSLIQLNLELDQQVTAYSNLLQDVVKVFNL